EALLTLSCPATPGQRIHLSDASRPSGGDLMRLSAHLFVLAVFFWQTTTTIAHATPFTYAFHPAATTLFGANTETISGSFTFDANTNTESAVSITLSGHSPYAGLYTTSSTQPTNPLTVTAQDQATLNRLALFFLLPLQFSPDPLTLVFFQSPQEF